MWIIAAPTEAIAATRSQPAIGLCRCSGAHRHDDDMGIPTDTSSNL